MNSFCDVLSEMGEKALLVKKWQEETNPNQTKENPEKSMTRVVINCITW